METKNIVLKTSAPLDDGGRKYNKLYFIFALIGVIIGFIVGEGAPIILGPFGLIVALVVKNFFATRTVIAMREYTFACDNKIDYELLIQGLQKHLMSLGMKVEIHDEGFPVITYQGMRYDVIYDDTDSIFTIWWSNSFGRAFFWNNIYIGDYRKATIAYGIIGYYVQQCCKKIVSEEG